MNTLVNLLDAATPAIERLDEAAKNGESVTLNPREVKALSDACARTFIELASYKLAVELGL